MIDLSKKRDPVEVLADEFASRWRRGECPSVFEYVAEYPEYASQIEELFPAVAMLEQLRTEETVRREAAIRQKKPARPPERLGDFRVIREIGRGGMGIVFEAEQQSLARRVALKILPKHVFLLDRHLERFRREAQTAAGLHHTNIVPVFGVGEQDGLHYYVMPLIRGIGVDEIIRGLRSADDFAAAASAPRGTTDTPTRDISRIVRALLARKRTTPRSGTRRVRPDASEDSIVSAAMLHSCGSSVRQSQPSNGPTTANGKHKVGCRPPDRAYWCMVAHIGVQAAEALEHAHAQGTLHRDIKPSNLLIDEVGVVRVADFGLASAVDCEDSNHKGQVVGTLRYMAPEQLRGAADARSDIYALGLTLYEMLTLRQAFGDSDRRRRPNGRPADLEPIRPRKLNKAIPRDLEAIVLKCIACDSSRRYPTASALAADLRRFLAHKPVRARRVSSMERAWRWCRRNPALAATSALAAASLLAVAATALTSYVHTRRAYAETKTALAQAEANSRLALDVLDDIYRQLSPDRVHIASDSDPGGDACACIGLRSGGGPAGSVGRTGMHVQASKETASLLENLLGFYDRLAEQVDGDSQVMLESAIAGRRVGDIRQRLGQIDQAERAYAKAAKKLAALRATWSTDATIGTELARAHNELGNIRSARLEVERAYKSHQTALAILQSTDQPDRLPEPCRYELARTLYFLGSKETGQTGSLPGHDPIEDAPWRRYRQSKKNEYRKSAVRILEELTRENPDAPDYRFLLALCHRPSGFAPTPAWNATNTRGRDRAIRILEELKSRYPGVADYRYELTATYAWVPVGLFPWQGRSAVSSAAERSLLNALEESQWLVAHHPTIPHYACSHALILAKLGMVCWNSRRLTEAEDLFRRAFENQNAVTAGFPGLPSHNRVLVEFMRLRLGQICHQRGVRAGDLRALGESRRLFETCIENLTELTGKSELAADRLAVSSLPVARNALSKVLAAIGQFEQAKANRQENRVDARIPPEATSPVAMSGGDRGP